MTFLIGNSTVKNVSLSDIDLNNTVYKISKEIINENLIKSVQLNGILESPVLVEENNAYITLAGHNRLYVLNLLGIRNINSLIVNNIDNEFFIQYAILKNYRSEIGPVGKMRLTGLLKNNFQLDERKIIAVLKQLQIPFEIIYGKAPWDRTGILPESLRKYIDAKDISFKNIKAMLRLPEYAVNLISDWVSDGMKVNIFKAIVEMLADIIKRDKSVKSLQHIDFNSINERRKKEEIIFKKVFKIRYPEYSGIRLKAESLIKKINKYGVEVNFPEYLESDEIGLFLKINKRENYELIWKKFAEIDMNLIKGLLELL